MGRHSRKRNMPPEAGPRPEAASRPETAPPAGHAPPTGAPQRPAGGAPVGGGPYPQAGSRRPPAVPRPYPGSPGPGGPATPAHGSPRPGSGTPPGGVPRVRGGHPEQRESGGGWGAYAAEGPARPADGQRRTPSGPRQEYVDAFDDGVFAAGAPSRTSPAPAVPHSRRPGERIVGPPRPGGPPGGQAAAVSEEEPWDTAHGPAEPVEDAPSRAKAKGRTFTGVAAAAVTTVLAVVVAGQVTGLEQRRENRTESADTGAAYGGDNPSRTAPTPSPSASREARPVTYTEKIGRIQPLDPELRGPGGFTTVGGHRKGPGRGEIVRYRVEVEKELPLDGQLFAEAVHRTLNDDRSWAHDGARSFERVTADEDADFVVTLASPGTTAEWCARSGLDTTVRNVSCDSALTDRIMINAWRWAQGSETFGDANVRAYREMLINHEVGHRLGLGHRSCESDGALAPVMMQQTKTLTTGERTCRPNPWPHPEGQD